MPESRKALRILAAVFLLVFELLFSVGIMIFTVVDNKHITTVSQFFLMYWHQILEYLIMLLIVIFLFSRKFTAAAIVSCLSLLFLLSSVVGNIMILSGSVASDYISDMRTYYIMMLISNLVFSVPALILQVLALFRHNRRSGKPLIAVFLLASAAAVFSNLALPISRGFSIQFYWTYLVISVPGILAALAWLFLGLYFKGQREPVQPEYVEKSYGTENMY